LINNSFIQEFVKRHFKKPTPNALQPTHGNNKIRLVLSNL